MYWHKESSMQRGIETQKSQSANLMFFLFFWLPDLTVSTSKVMQQRKMTGESQLQN
jgi:hypothetical protein